MKNTTLFVEIKEILKEQIIGARTHEDKKIAEAEEATAEHMANRIADYMCEVGEFEDYDREAFFEELDVEDLHLIY